ncbi:hypothetical protein NBRC111893_1043 [Lentilactobacillus kosonis]|uniref:Uncharacterized protein n=1 Tax=Lentilactobacillus kosonis TaxID=2810561 RepID=A0A401FKN9_9LACO|nr:hypothetical protein NBRC111893_1043 [Lentilactobacillus kosonis]
MDKISKESINDALDKSSFQPPTKGAEHTNIPTPFRINDNNHHLSFLCGLNRNNQS